MLEIPSHTVFRSFIFAVITQITNLDSKSNTGKRKKIKNSKKQKERGGSVTLWLIGKKFETAVGVSFNTINHLCWNILHNPSFSCPCCYFPPSTWYKMYILFVVLESHFSHAVVEGLRTQPVTAPFGLGGGCRFSAFIWSPELTSSGSAQQAAWGDADSFSTSFSATRLRP